MRREYIMIARKLSEAEPGPQHHQIAVDNLAKMLNCSREGVNAVYGLVLRRYMKTARIKYFLTALVTKRVKEVLRDTTPTTDIEGRKSHSREL
jgi:hypothetical protein